MKRIAVLIYGIIAYFLFFGTFCYLIGFVGDLFVPKSIEGELSVPLWQALLTNVALILLFGLQHSIMARSWFKKWWTQFIPEPIERSTYVLFTVFALIAMFVFWQPLGGMVWSIESDYLAGVSLAFFALGWIIVLASSFLINHFDLFGLRQTWLYFRGKPYTPLAFRIPIFYKYVRHPLYFGLLLSFWSTSTMSVTRLVFALLFTIYVLRAMRWEENDLIQHFGDKYRSYMKKVPMIFPRIFRKKKQRAYETLIKKEQV